MPFYEKWFAFHARSASAQPLSELSIALIRFFESAQVNFFTDQYARAIEYQNAFPDGGEALSDSFMYNEAERLIKELKLNQSPDDAVRVACMYVTMFHDCIKHDESEHGFAWVNKLRSSIHKDNPDLVKVLRQITDNMVMNPERRSRQVSDVAIRLG